MKSLSLKSLAFALLMSVSAVVCAQPLLQESRIYLLDVTASMQGRGMVATPDIFDVVKEKLQASVNNIQDKTTEVTIIPFTSRTFPEYRATIASKDSLNAIISGLQIRPGDTNIADAWQKAVSLVDSTKINYIFLLTDGLHNCGPSQQELFSRLVKWEDFSRDHYYFAFYVMLTPNAKEQEICKIVDEVPNLWLIESMDIDASLVKSQSLIKKNVFDDKWITVNFSSNNDDVDLCKVGVNFDLKENPFYEVDSVYQNVNTTSYHLRLKEKKDKIEMPLVDTLMFCMSHDKEEYPFVFFTPDYFTAVIANQGPRRLSITTSAHADNYDYNIDFGRARFREPFMGPFKYLRKYLEPTLDYMPFCWFRPDTISVSKNMYLTFNEECVRSSSSLNFLLKDSDNATPADVDFLCGFGNELRAISTDVNEIDCSLTVLPGRENGRISGPFILRTNNLDYVNSKEISSDEEVLCEWYVDYEKKGAVMLWLMWILSFLIILGLLIWGIVLLFKYLIALLTPVYESLTELIGNILSMNRKIAIHGISPEPRRKNKSMKRSEQKESKCDMENEEDAVARILRMEKILYETEVRVADKYDVLENMKLDLSDYYESAREVYDECYKRLLPNTWDALETAWRERYPKRNVNYSKEKSEFELTKSHKYYKACSEIGFTSCTYDVHGGPDFDKVTANDSIVNISDLYDRLSATQISKRGGSSDSLQEIAQELMAEKLERTLRKWWAANSNAPFDRYKAFYAWRDANNLVPHEDTNCRTMRLVYRPAHESFVHCGGVSNAINIKNHFS